MKILKSERHHWWPQCVSRYWADEDGKTGWLKPDGTCLRVPPAKLGVIGNAHHIKLGSGGEPTPWDESFERAFDRADSRFPELIRWLEQLERRPMRDVTELRDRFVAVPTTDDRLALMTECAVSLAVRGPMNREASVALAEHLRGPIRGPERDSLIAVNMRHSQRVVADSLGARGKFVAVYSQHREFVFGDGFFHNIANAQMAPMSPRLFVPITPGIAILVCRPAEYTVEPRLCTLVLEDHEVDTLNHAVQVYSKDAIFFRSQMPAVHGDFRRRKHLRYAHLGNPINCLIHSIPGVTPRDSSLDALFDEVPQARGQMSCRPQQARGD